MSESNFDCIVVGIGGHGSSSLAHLAKRGERVLGLEKFPRSSHAHGSSHGRSRIIRLAYFEDPCYVPLLRRSFELWRELSDNFKSAHDDCEPILTMTGGLMIGLPESTVVTGTLKSVQTHSLAHEVLSAAEIRQRFPAFQPNENEIGILEKEAGYLVPELCVQAHCELAETHGAELHFEEPMISWTALTHGVEVTTSKGTYTAKKLVLTVGAWAPELYGQSISELMPLTASRRALFWFEPKEPDSSAFDHIPVYIWDIGEQGNFYGFPKQSGPPGGVKVAMHFVDSSIQTECTPATIDRAVQTMEVSAMKAVLTDRMPLLPGSIVDTATCMYTNTVDENFLIDWHPQSRGSVLLVSPCSGHGFKFCSVIGEIVADLLVDGTSRHDVGIFQFGKHRLG